MPDGGVAHPPSGPTDGWLNGGTWRTVAVVPGNGSRLPDHA